jgi:hypothetical protein
MLLGPRSAHRKDQPLAGIQLNGGDWFPAGGAKQDSVTGWGVSANVLARVRASGQTCAQSHAGARGCMPGGDPRRRASGGTEKATTRPCALSIEDSKVKGGDLGGFWVQLSRRRDTRVGGCIQVVDVLAPAHKRARMCTGVAKSP